jgi:rubrerythrin
MLNPNEFVKKIRNENQALFEASKMNVKAYFEDDLPEEEMVNHFIGRMVNERMNMSEISMQVANASDDTDPKELELLSRQAADEAKHFRMVREVIEHIKGEKIDVSQALESERKSNTAKGAALLEKYDAQQDEAVLAAYQLVAEGRAEAVWNQMADTIQDDFISTRYREIAKDEGFHSAIGGHSLRKLATDEETQNRVQRVVESMRKDLFEISCRNTVEAEGSRELVNAAYGW